MHVYVVIAIKIITIIVIIIYNIILPSWSPPSLNPFRYSTPDTDALVFGKVRVSDEATQQLLLANTGPYPVDFKFAVKSAAHREVFSIEPESGTLEVAGPKSTPQPIKVVFNAGG